MENFEKVLKMELGVFEKHFVEFSENMRQEMLKFKAEVKDEIRDSFFVFEQEYGTKIDVMHDIIVLNKEKTDEKINILEKQVKTNEMRILKNALDIDSLKSKKVNSKTDSKKLNSKI